MVGSRIRRVHLLKSDLRPRGESLGAATLPRFAVNLQNRFTHHHVRSLVVAMVLSTNSYKYFEKLRNSVQSKCHCAEAP